MDSDLESKLISLFSQLLTQMMYYSSDKDVRWKQIQNTIIQIVSLVRSMDLESQPKQELSEFMSLIIQMKSVFKSMDLDSQPKPLSKLISHFTQLLNPTNSDSVTLDANESRLFIEKTRCLEPEPELISLIYQIFSLVSDMNPKNENLFSLCPQTLVKIGDDNILQISEERQFPSKYDKWECLINRVKFAGGEGSSSYFLCFCCFGKNHERYEKAPVEIKHPLHPKHPLKLALFAETFVGMRRKCYCCDEYISQVIYCCLTCDYILNITCVAKPRVLSRDHPEWHDHPLALFPTKAPLTCNLCGLADSSCPFYICPPCDFSVHQSCLTLPYVIRISPHHHRISFTPSFNQGSFSCGVCRKQIHNDYGGYYCIKSGCSYAAHTRCATQSNLWDGEDLEGVPEEIEEVLEPFVRIRDGIIRHFSHQEHHLRFDENTNRDYDENKLCQACTTPIYFGNLYSCMQCDFILHEECANLPRKTYHPIHPHQLTLVGKWDGVIDYNQGLCSACDLICTTGFLYKCGKEECNFKVHVQCGTITEPLIHGSHLHPLFLTSKPEDWRHCSVCKIPRRRVTFNCIECDFSLCFRCATIPQKVRYKLEKHMLTLSYGKEASTMASWCEICEEKINPEEMFYMCDEDYCVTLHVECMIGKDLYMKPGSSFLLHGHIKVEVIANNLHMSRPFCNECWEWCTQKIVFKMSGLMFCSRWCADYRPHFLYS